jgi:hypothetical protein
MQVLLGPYQHVAHAPCSDTIRIDPACLASPGASNQWVLDMVTAAAAAAAVVVHMQQQGAQDLACQHIPRRTQSQSAGSSHHPYLSQCHLLLGQPKTQPARSLGLEPHTLHAGCCGIQAGGCVTTVQRGSACSTPFACRKKQAAGLPCCGVGARQGFISARARCVEERTLLC